MSLNMIVTFREVTVAGRLTRVSMSQTIAPTLVGAGGLWNNLINQPIRLDADQLRKAEVELTNRRFFNAGAVSEPRRNECIV